MKKVIALGLTVLLCFLVSGCNHEHSLSLANYQYPAKCSVCGEYVGEPLTPDFVKYGIKCNMEIGKEYEYTTCCTENTSFSTTGTAAIIKYEVIPNDDDHPYKDAHEWRVIDLKLTFNDENAQKYGMKIRTSADDYYDINLRDSSSVMYKDKSYEVHTVNYKGQNYDCIFRQTNTWSGWHDAENGGREDYCISHWEIQVPIGYDGTVIGIYDSRLDWDNADHIYNLDVSTFLMFRLE